MAEIWLTSWAWYFLPLFTSVSYIQTVVVWDFWTINSRYNHPTFTTQSGSRASGHTVTEPGGTSDLGLEWSSCLQWWGFIFIFIWYECWESTPEILVGHERHKFLATFYLAASWFQAAILLSSWEMVHHFRITASGKSCINRDLLQLLNFKHQPPKRVINITTWTWGSSTLH